MYREYEFSGYLIALLGTLITVYKIDPWQDHNNFIPQPDNLEIAGFYLTL